MASYRELEALPPEAYLDASRFVTCCDKFAENVASDLAGKKYQTGLKYGMEAKEQKGYISLSYKGVWGASYGNCDVSSSEGIGYHACTASLLQGFLDSGCEIRVTRYRDGQFLTTKIR